MFSPLALKLIGIALVGALIIGTIGSLYVLHEHDVAALATAADQLHQSQADYAALQTAHAITVQSLAQAEADVSAANAAEQDAEAQATAAATKTRSIHQEIRHVAASHPAAVVDPDIAVVLDRLRDSGREPSGGGGPIPAAGHPAVPVVVPNRAAGPP